MKAQIFAGIVALQLSAGLLPAVAQDGATVLSTAQDHLREGRLEKAEAAFKEALDQKAPAGDCHLGLAMVHSQMTKYGDAIDDAERAFGAYSDDAGKARARNQQGIAWIRKGRSGKALESARASFQGALDLSGGQLNFARYGLAQVLIRQHKTEEALKLLKDFVERSPGGSEETHSRAILAHPDRAADPYSPDFAITTLEGKTIKSADLRGKVIVLDFWATWCGPCQEAIPSLKKIAKRSASDPLVIIGISADDNQDKLTRFIAQNGMSWAEAWDKTGELGHGLFGVEGLPTYVVIDHEGFIVYRTMGWSIGTGRQLDAKIDSALAKVGAK